LRIGIAVREELYCIGGRVAAKAPTAADGGVWAAFLSDKV
jgi:hypothetical protein